MEIYKCILYVWRGKRNRTQRRTKIPQAISSLDFLPTRFSCWFRKAQKKEQKAHIQERRWRIKKTGGMEDPCLSSDWVNDWLWLCYAPHLKRKWCQIWTQRNNRTTTHTPGKEKKKKLHTVGPNQRRRSMLMTRIEYVHTHTHTQHAGAPKSLWTSLLRSLFVCLASTRFFYAVRESNRETVEQQHRWVMALTLKGQNVSLESP